MGEQEGGICTCREDGTVDCSSEVIRRATQCLDNEGGARSVGEVWTVECNTCRCTENGLAACTLKTDHQVRPGIQNHQQAPRLDEHAVIVELIIVVLNNI